MITIELCIRLGLAIFGIGLAIYALNLSRKNMKELDQIKKRWL
jgi:Na+/phosphate symporter